MCVNALHGVGKLRRQSLSNLPLGSSTLQVATASSFRDCTKFIIFVNVSFPTFVSGLRMSMYSPFASFIALLFAFEKPILLLFSINFTQLNFDLTKLDVPSDELLSTTKVSLSILFAAVFIDSRQSSKSSFVL